MAKGGLSDRRLSDDDIHAIRCFIRQALLPYTDDIRDFYYSIDTLDLETGEHPWALRERGPVLGYMVVRSGPRDFRSTCIFPYARPSKIDIGVPCGSKPAVLNEAMREPVDVEEFLVYYKRGKLCFLTREMAQAELDEVRLQATVLLSREEAFALLGGEALGLTLDKVRKAFGIRRIQ